MDAGHKQNRRPMATADMMTLISAPNTLLLPSTDDISGSVTKSQVTLLIPQLCFWLCVFIFSGESACVCVCALHASSVIGTGTQGKWDSVCLTPGLNRWRFFI